MRCALTFVAWLAATLPALWAFPVYAQACIPRAEFVERLAQKYGETPVGLGKVSGSVIVEVFTSRNGTWTVIATASNGYSCLIVNGDGWQAIPQNFDPES